jgi:hypothetical protein
LQSPLQIAVNLLMVLCLAEPLDLFVDVEMRRLAHALAPSQCPVGLALHVVVQFSRQFRLTLAPRCRSLGLGHILLSNALHVCVEPELLQPTL